MKCRSLLATTAVAVALLSATVSSAKPGSDVLPVKLSFDSEVQYAERPDYSVSDEFNSDAEYEAKWYRRILPAKVGKGVDREDKDLVQFESEAGVKYISFKGRADDERGKNIRTSGIISRTTSYGGLYVARFRILGLDSESVKEKGTVWHPSIWCGKWGKDYDTSKFTKSESWLEIDFIEWEGDAWSGDAPARFQFSNGAMGKVNDRDKVKFGAKKAVMVDVKDNKDRDNEAWTTLALEYNEKFMKIWEYKDGKWVDISSRRVDFVDEDPKRLEDSFRINTLGKSAYKPVTWILGNVTSPWTLGRLTGDDDSKRPSCEDMSIDIDFFRYYPCVE